VQHAMSKPADAPIIHVWRVGGPEVDRSDFRLATEVSSFKADHFHALALMKDGRVLSWGRGALGLLGHGDENDVETPRIIESIGAAVAVSCGPYHSSVVTEKGQLITFGWHFEVSSQGIVQQTFTAQPIPVIGFPLGMKIAGVACGCYATAAWPGTGQLFTWGVGSSGQLGHGSFNDEPLPRRVEALEGVRIVQAAYGGIHSGVEHSGFLIARSTSGKVYSFGSTKFGRLGRRTADSLETSGAIAHHSLPGQVKLSDESPLIAIDIAASDHHAAAVTPHGKLFVWGAHDGARLGPDIKTDRFTPTQVQVVADDRIVSVACTAVSTMCLSAEGEAVLLGSKTLPDTKTATEFETVHTICTDNPVLKIFGGGYMYAALEAPWKPPEKLLVESKEPEAPAMIAPPSHDALSVVPREIADILLADVKHMPHNQLRQELLMLKELLVAERMLSLTARAEHSLGTNAGKVAYFSSCSGTRAQENEEVKHRVLPVTSVDKFFGGQFEHFWQEPKPYDWPYKPSICIVHDDEAEQKTPETQPTAKPSGIVVHQAPASILYANPRSPKR